MNIIGLVFWLPGLILKTDKGNAVLYWMLTTECWSVAWGTPRDLLRVLKMFHFLEMEGFSRDHYLSWILVHKDKFIRKGRGVSRHH